ncbi:unnamed protein product, partial [Ectocarpus sp. 4 AP-2014]
MKRIVRTEGHGWLEYCEQYFWLRGLCHYPLVFSRSTDCCGMVMVVVRSTAKYRSREMNLLTD